MIELDGWQQVWQKESHRQYHHPIKSGTVTVAGNSSVDVYPGTLISVLKLSGAQAVEVYMRYMIVIEEGPTSFGAYVPDLPGCMAVGESSQEALQLIQEAIEFHIEGLKEEGQRIPMPHSSSSFVEVRT